MSDHEGKLDPRIQTLLDSLRWRIRAYVFFQGLGLALIWLGVTFWISLALDYLPVLAGAREMPWEARGALLLLVSVVLAWLLYHGVLRRTLVPLSDRSLALLIERRFPVFRDALVTAVELRGETDHAEPYDAALLDRTAAQARAGTEQVHLRQIFRLAPLVRSLLGAAAMLATLALFYAVSPPALARSLQRLYLLDDRPWPRQAQIEVVGIELLGSEDGERTGDLPQLEFGADRRVKVARGSNVRVRARARLGAAVVPELCILHYGTDDGQRGRVVMNRMRRTRGQYQEYAFEGRPFQGILASVRFDVVGYDHRVRDYGLEVVDPPTIVAAEADCRFPEYLVDERLSLWLPRTVPLTPGTQLPRGTELQIRARANKPLERVELFHPESGERVVLPPTGPGPEAYEFQYPIPALDGDLTLDVTLYDTDRVVSERPYRMFIAAVADEPPEVNVRLHGIGSAVTPNVIVPIEGTIQDDYAVDRAWFEWEVARGGANEAAAERVQDQLEFTVGSGGRAESAVDFRELRSRSTAPVALQPGDSLSLVVRAADRYDLNGGPNVGSGDRYQLDVVTPDVLLSLLESREIGLRRRFELIVGEMKQARDDLNRVRYPVPPRGLEWDDVPPEDREAEPDPETVAERQQALRLLRSQQALQQTRKSMHEVLGVAASFAAVRQELINNRVDTADRMQRLKDLISDPLQAIGEQRFPELEASVEQLEAVLTAALDAGQFQPEVARGEATDALAQVDQILAELEEVLQQMLDLETFSELLEIVRQMIEDQQRLIERTEAERREGLLRDLQ